MLKKESTSEFLRGGEVEVDGRLLECLVCCSGRFEHRGAQVHSRLSTMLGLGWLGPTSDCLVHVECGYIHWYQRTPWRVGCAVPVSGGPLRTSFRKHNALRSM